MTLPIETPAVVEDRPELASKIQEQFDKVFADVNESDLLDDETPAPEDKPEAEEKPAADAGAEAEETTEEAPAEEAVVDEPADQKPAAAKEAAPTNKGPTLPDAYRRSLKAYEWTDEEINANLAAMGPAFIQTAAKIHQNRNKELAGWAEAGRKQRTDSAVTVNTPAAAGTPQAQRQTPAPDATTRLQPVDAAALKKQYGEEALIDAIVGPVNATIEQINRILPVVQQTQHRAAEAQLETFARQIDGFFAGKDMTAYAEQYGKSSAALSNEQLGARQKVLEFADALVAGARQQGRLLSLDEAMQMAHDSTAAGGQQRAARQQIKTEMKARNKGITLKPSARGSGTAVAANRSTLEKSVKKGLAAAFNS